MNGRGWCAWGAVFLFAGLMLTAPVASGIDPGLLYQWCLVEAPMEYVQYAPYEARTWTFRHPGASSMKVRFDSVNLIVDDPANYLGERARLEILNGSDQVVQTLYGTQAAMDSVSVPGGVIKVRYVANANGGAGTLFGGGTDRFRVAGYKYYRSIFYTEGAGGPLNYQVMSPLPPPAQPYKIYRHSRCEIPLAVKKPFNWGTQDSTKYKVDFFLDACFVGSSTGYGVMGDWNSIYFGVQLDLAQWLSQHGGQSHTLCIRETRYVTNSLTRWRTDYQYYNLSMSMADDRAVFTTSMPLEGVSPVTTAGRWFYLPNYSMIHAAAEWAVGGGSPGVDVRLRLYNENMQVLADSYHLGINQGSGHGSTEGIAAWVSPGFYRVEMSRTTGSCAGFGFTAWLYVNYDPEGWTLYY